jgi:hypothetical protein
MAMRYKVSMSSDNMPFGAKTANVNLNTLIIK